MMVKRRTARPRTRSRYGNVKCEEDGIQFDSLAELAYYRVLKARKASGDILSFSRPAPTLYLDLDGRALGRYTPDFIVYERGQALPLLVEIKGRAAPDFRLRWLLARTLYADRYRFLFVGQKEPRLLPVPKTRRAP